MGTNASVVDSSVRWEILLDAERRGDRTGWDSRDAAFAAATLPPGPGSIPLREILTDPALIRIACLAAGLSVLFLAIAAVL